MQQSMEPVARELAKEAKSLRERIGAWRLKNAIDALASEADDGAGPDTRTESGLAIGFTAAQAEDLSLLWPRNRDDRTAHLPEDTIRDLSLADVASVLAGDADRKERRFITDILCQLCDDPEVIRFRQDVLADLLRYPELASGLEDLLPRIENLTLESIPSRQATELFQIAWWLGILETYTECIEEAGELFTQVDGKLASEGLRLLREQIVSIREDETFQNLVRELPGLLSRVRGVLSITVGINLTPDLQPESATLLSVNDERFSEAPLLRMLLGKVGDHEGVMPLHLVPSIPGHRGGEPPNPMLIPLFRDLSKVMSEVTRPVARALSRYTHLSYHLLGRLRPELAFYVGAAKLVSRMQAAGLPMCQPELSDREERVTEVEDSYNLHLALRLLDRGAGTELNGTVVENDVALNSRGRIVVLTGPNQGGKTTYTQGVGLIQVLAQVGLYVPGSKARLSPVDNVYTHFPVEEELSEGTGRFGDEARRLSDIFQGATRHSLVLLNEPLSGTYPGESFYLARDLLRIWRLLGTRVILTTHMHELAAQVDELNEQTPGDSPIISMVSSRIGREPTASGSPQSAIERSYRVVKSPPMGRSYARELAMLYGISYEQLMDLLHERGLLDPKDDI